MLTETFHHLPLTFCANRKPSVNFLCSKKAFRKLPSTIHAAGPLRKLPWTFRVAIRCCVTFRVADRHSANLCQISEQPGDLPSTYVQFSCHREIFCQHLTIFRLARLPSVKVTYGCETFLQLPLNFRAAGWPSVNFREISVRPENVNFHLAGSLSISFPVTCRFSINFSQLSVPSGELPSTFVQPEDLSSTFCAPMWICVNFLCSRETFCYVGQLFVPSINQSINQYWTCLLDRRSSLHT